MPADPFTPAELEAGARAVGRARHFVDTDGYPSLRIGTNEDEAHAVLAAVAPLIAARVRAETADGIAQAIEATIYAGIALPEDLRPAAGRPGVATYAEWAARIARAHRTTPTEEPS